MRRFDILAILTVTSLTSVMHRPNQPTVEPITLAVVNARIWTGDSRHPWIDAMAISRERISAMVKLAEPHLPITSDQLDADPWLLNCPNGTIDLRICELRPHRREDFCTKICRIN